MDGVLSGKNFTDFSEIVKGFFDFFFIARKKRLCPLGESRRILFFYRAAQVLDMIAVIGAVFIGELDVWGAVETGAV